MMRRMLAFCCLAAVLLTVPGRSQGISSPLASEPKLRASATLRVEGLPVSDLLAELARKSGAALAADASVADEKVMVFGPARPLHQVLADLAALLNARWERRSGPKYVLVRDPRARQLDEALSREVTARLLARLDQQVRALAETPEQLMRRPENDWIRRLLSAQDLRLGPELYAALNPAQREALLTRKRLSVPFTALAPGQQEPLRQQFAERIRVMQEFLQNDEMGRKMAAQAGLSLDREEDLDRSSIRFRVQNTSGYVSISICLGLLPVYTSLEPDSETGRPVYTGSLGVWPVAIVDGRDTWLLPPNGNPYGGESGITKTPAPVAAVQAALQERAFPDRLRKLAETAGIPVLSDYYRGRPVVQPDLNPVTGETPLARLDELCRPAGYLWWQSGKTLLFRKRDWYTQRRYEVPDRWLLAASERLRGNAPTYGDALRLLELTQEQLCGLNAMSGRPYAYDDDELTGVPQLLALVKAWGRAAAPLPPRAAPPAEKERTLLRYPAFTPLQRSLMPAFLETVDYPVRPEEIPGFTLRLSGDSSTQPVAAPPGGADGSEYRTYLVHGEWRLGVRGRSLFGLGVPLSLPDDRRHRTRIDLTTE